MDTARISAPAWEITRLFLGPAGAFTERYIATVYAHTQDSAIHKAAETINGPALLKARKIKNLKCPVCGAPISARTCRPMRQPETPSNGQDAEPK